MQLLQKYSKDFQKNAKGDEKNDVKENQIGEKHDQIMFWASLYLRKYYQIKIKQMDYNSIMALKELVAEEGEDDQEIVQNFYKGSMLNPGAIGSDGK